MDNSAFISIKNGRFYTQIPSEAFLDAETDVFPVSPEIAILCVEINGMLKNKDIDLEEVKSWKGVKMVQIKKHPRNNRTDYFALKSNIDSSNVASGASVPALKYGASATPAPRQEK